MTPEEAIETIEVARAEVEWEYPMNYAIAFDVAIEALKKQIPKKPKAEYFTNGSFIPRCSNCMAYISEDAYYCKDCGHKLDWR